MLTSSPCTSASLADRPQRSDQQLSAEQNPIRVNLKTQESPPRFDRTSSSRGPSSLGLSAQSPHPPYSHISSQFYETIGNIKPPQPSCTNTSSTDAARCANSSLEADKRYHGSTPPVMPMSAQNDTNDRDPPEGCHPAPSTVRSSSSASYQRPFVQMPFPAQQYFPPHSAPPQEQPYAPAAPYRQQPTPGSFVGQYMTSQPPHPLAVQSPIQYGFHSFSHPGIHAQETSPLGMPYSQHHPQNRGYPYPLPPTSSEPRPNDSGNTPAQGYPRPSPPFAETAGLPQQTVSTSSTPAPHVSHHAYSPVHYSQPPATSHYPAYPGQSFSHSSPTMYPYIPPPPGAYQQSFYSQQPASPEDASNVGPWWYLPPGAQQYDPSAYPSRYPMPGYQPSMQMGHSEFDPRSLHSTPGSGSPSAFAAPSNQRKRVLSGPTRERAPSSSPVARHPATDVLHDESASPLSKKPSPHSLSPPPASRKSYHPNPPPNRSEWVMWVGNVPSDATHDELWHFFNQTEPPRPPPPGASSMASSRQLQPGNEEGDVWGGVSSVFLISRSNCTFINFETEEYLMRAVAHFNGKPLRPRDSRCPRLVCRVRRKDDDLRAGVGGQRGMGIHTRWVAEQKEREREARRKERASGGHVEGSEGGEDTESGGEGPPTSPTQYLSPSNSSDPSPPVSDGTPTDEHGVDRLSGAPRSDRGPRQAGSSGNHSFTSTSSSFLATHFPKRYFILKSLTQYDLNLSLDRGVWATQPHNEGILDQAYRTSKDVYLIFGANKSGEFFGYARMAGPISPNERVDHVLWAVRSSGQGGGASGRSGPDAIKEEDETTNVFSLSENRLVDESPMPITPGEEASLQQLSSTDRNPNPHTTPAEVYQPHKALSHPERSRDAETLPDMPRMRNVASPRTISEGIFLANRENSRALSGKQEHKEAAEGVGRAIPKNIALKERRRLGKEDEQTPNAMSAIPAKPSTALSAPHKEVDVKPEGWGREFKIQWLRTERVPFHRTRHLRNPWNHDREVKVSRDGTELEPTVGQALLNEWDNLPRETETSPPTSPAARGRGSKPFGRSAATRMSSLSSQSYGVDSSGVTGQSRRRSAS